MTRTEFLAALEHLLAPLPYEERKDALNYYEDFFDAAGPEHEAQAIAELGTPEEVARKILDAQFPHEKSAAPKTNHWHMWLGGGVVVLALCLFFFQHSGATPVQQEKPASSETTASSVEASAPEESSNSGDAVPSLPASDDASQSTFQIPLAELTEQLKLDFSYGSVTFIVDPDAAFATFQFDNFKADHLTRSTDGTGKLTFRYDLSKDADINDAQLTITMPETTLKELDIHIASGDLDLGTLQADELDVKLTAGDFSADTLTAEKLHISQTAGDLSVQQLTAASVDASTTSGDIRIGLLSGGEDVSLSAVSGDFDVTMDGAPSDYYIRANTMIGNFQTSSPIENSDPNSPRKLQLRVISGDAVLRFTES